MIFLRGKIYQRGEEISCPAGDVISYGESIVIEADDEVEFEFGLGIIWHDDCAEDAGLYCPRSPIGRGI